MRRAALILLPAIALLAIDRPLVEILTRYDAMRTSLARQADRVPEFTRFVEAVRARTRPGDSIAIVVFPAARDQYPYFYYRASYLLADRRVIPIFTADLQLRAGAAAEADYAAAYRARVGGSGRVIWRGLGGELVARR